MNELTLFYFFSLLSIVAALSVVFSKNSVRGVLFLVLTFISTAAIWLMLQAEFLAITLVLVYVGAVMVLFLFVVMMLDIEVGGLKMSFKKNLPVGLFVMALMIAILVFAVGGGYFDATRVAIPENLPASASNVKALGELLYTSYILPFETAGVLLLVAMIAAIALTFRGHRSKFQDASKQVRANKADRLTVLKMPSEQQGGIQS